LFQKGALLSGKHSMVLACALCGIKVRIARINIDKCTEARRKKHSAKSHSIIAELGFI
jgi:hypothetical protein